MGKPSSSKNSNHTFMGKKKMNSSVGAQKSKTMKKRKRTKTKKKIQKLFETLRRDSEISLEISHNDSVISLDNTIAYDTTIGYDTILEVPQTSVRKRKNTSIVENETKKNRRKSDSLIIINDDDLVTNDVPCGISSPLHTNTNINCSTPVSKKNDKTLQDLIVNNFPKSNNNLSSVKNFNEDVINLTKEINRDSYLTIDLTADGELSKSNVTSNTVIDVDNCTIGSSDCTIVSVSNASLSMSGDSEVTVLSKDKKSDNKEIKKFTNGIAKLNSSQKGKLLEFIAQKIFTGCNVPLKLRNSLSEIRQSVSRATETVEDTYIKEVILGEAPSRNSVGSNIYRPSRDPSNKTGLRMIVIDGSNVAMEHTKGKTFSVMALKICIDYFMRRGHVVKAFVPRFRCKFGKSSDPQLLSSLERRGLVVFTPSREIQGKNVVSYDDRYIVQCAVEFDGVIVSGDNYRDLMSENPRWRFVIENRLLPFTWVDDMIMFPRDPLGRNGPTLENFLKHAN